jgi:short-subunit dehydrogenase
MSAGGQLALVASMAGTVGIYGYSAYGASKFAVLGMAQCLRAEYAPKGITISVICPPEIDTPMVQTEIQTMHPATRVLKDIAGRLTLTEAISQITRGLARKQFMVIPGKMAKATYWLNRLTPNWLNHKVVDFLVAKNRL